MHKDEWQLFLSSPTEEFVSNAALKLQHGLTNLHQLLYSGVSTLSNGYGRARTDSADVHCAVKMEPVFSSAQVFHWCQSCSFESLDRCKGGVTVFPTSLQGGVRKK